MLAFSICSWAFYDHPLGREHIHQYHSRYDRTACNAHPLDLRSDATSYDVYCKIHQPNTDYSCTIPFLERQLTFSPFGKSWYSPYQLRVSDLRTKTSSSGHSELSNKPSRTNTQVSLSIASSLTGALTSRLVGLHEVRTKKVMNATLHRAL